MTENQLRYRLRRCGYGLRKSRRDGYFAVVALTSYGDCYPVFGMTGSEHTADLAAIEAWAADRGII